MSTRRAVRAARATRTTRRTVEQQQLHYQHQQLDPSGLAGPFGSSASGAAASDAYYASGAAGAGGGLAGDGSAGLGDSGGYYSRRPLPPRGKPTRKWIHVRRPPAVGVGFKIAVWVPVDQLTEAERAAHLPPSTKVDAALKIDAMDIDPPLAGSLVQPPTVDARADVEAPTTLETDLGTRAAPPGPQQQGLGNTATDETASRADDASAIAAGPDDLIPLAENAVEDALLSPNDRPTKRARFAQDGNEHAAATPLGEQPASASVGPSRSEGQEFAAQASTVTATDVWTEPSSGDPSTNPAMFPTQTPAAYASEVPAALSSVDNASGRKRDLPGTEPLLGDGGEEAALGDGPPPPKRPRASAEDDDDCRRGAAIATIVKESDAGTGAGGPTPINAGMSTATLGIDGDAEKVAVMEHDQLPADENLHSSTRVGGSTADVNGELPGPLSDPSQSTVDRSNDAEK